MKNIERMGNAHIISYEALAHSTGFNTFKLTIISMLEQMEVLIEKENYDGVDFSTFSLTAEKDQWGLILKMSSDAYFEVDDDVEAIKAIAIAIENHE